MFAISFHRELRGTAMSKVTIPYDLVPTKKDGRVVFDTKKIAPQEITNCGHYAVTANGKVVNRGEYSFIFPYTAPALPEPETAPEAALELAPEAAPEPAPEAAPEPTPVPVPKSEWVQLNSRDDQFVFQAKIQPLSVGGTTFTTFTTFMITRLVVQVLPIQTDPAGQVNTLKTDKETVLSI